MQFPCECKEQVSKTAESSAASETRLFAQQCGSREGLTVQGRAGRWKRPRRRKFHKAAPCEAALKCPSCCCKSSGCAFPLPGSPGAGWFVFAGTTKVPQQLGSQISLAGPVHEQNTPGDRHSPCVLNSGELFQLV